MDWRRAKNVLLLAFLVLNAVLGYQLWQEWQERLDMAVDWTSLPPETLRAIQEKGIRIEASFPTETPVMREITYSLVNPPSAAGGAEIRIPLETPRESRIVINEKELRDALGGVIPELDRYALDPLGSTDGVFVLNRMEDGWPMFDVRLKLYSKDQKIVAYSQDRIKSLSTDGSAGQKVLPAARAVAHLIENDLPKGAVVKEIRLGYHGQFFDSETQVSAPSWRVLLEDGEVIYVNAISGERM
jgi:regulatory protein YycI of two-component signal transduction system YycFG